jgi:hypothetical protein
MQAAKALKGSHMNPADHQDERYSYVVIRRGARPINVAQVEISRAFLPNEGTGEQVATNNDPSGGVAGSEEFHSVVGEGIQKLQSSSTTPDNLWQQKNGQGWSLAPLDQPAANTVAVAGTAGDVAYKTRHSGQGLVMDHELQQLSALAGLDQVQQQVLLPQRLGKGELTAASVGDADSKGHDHFKHTNVKLGAFGQGLVDRLVALEDAGVDWAGAGGASLPPQLAAQAEEQAGRATAKPEGANIAEAAVESRADPPDNRSQEMSDTRNNLPSAEVNKTAAASITWSRLIRPPRKRGGHVILDVCAANSGSEGPQVATGGQLERHVVARSDTKKWMGRAAYLMVQTANWGDLWPSFYNRNPKRQTLTSPT